MLKYHTLILVTLLLASSCGFEKREKAETEILGKWMMSQVIQSDEDVSLQHNPEEDRWIEFNRDGGFTSDGSVGRNTGKWSLDQEGVLSIDSDAGSDDDSSWQISIEGEEMTWKGLGSAFAQNFVLVHRRSKQ